MKNVWCFFLNNMCSFHIYSPFCLFVLFCVARAIFQLSGDCHHYRWRAANLDLCLALTAFSSEGSFTCLTYCDTGHPFLRSYPKDPWFSHLNAMLLAKEQLIPILNVLGLTRHQNSGAQTHDLPFAERVVIQISVFIWQNLNPSG
jgi:hypothetical protein